MVEQGGGYVSRCRLEKCTKVPLQYQGRKGFRIWGPWVHKASRSKNLRKIDGIVFFSQN